MINKLATLGSANYLVAFFDIMGFSSWVENEGSLEVFNYIRGFMNLMIRSSLPNSIVNEDMSVDLSESNIDYINFSDSIVFYTKNDSFECFETLLSVCSQFMNVVICGPSRMLRGAIAYGEMYIDKSTNAYVGKALIDAYKLEGVQDVLACSLHKSVEMLPYFDKYRFEHQNKIIKLNVPLRNTNVYPYCIKWFDKDVIHGFFNVRKSIQLCYERGLASIGNDEKELNKLKSKVFNTLDLINRYE